MRDDPFRRNGPTIHDLPEQRFERSHLRLRKRPSAIVIQFNSYGA